MDRILDPTPRSRHRATAWRMLPVVLVMATACTRVGTAPPAGAPVPATEEPAGPTVPRGTEAPGPATRPAPDADAGVPEWSPAVSRPVGGDPSPFGPGGVRAVWVVRTSMTSPERVRQVVADAERAGINTLIVQVRGRADAWYTSSVEPRASGIADGPPDEGGETDGGMSVGFDPLAELLRLARPRGIHVHAWIATHLVWGMGPALPDDPGHLVRAHPEWLAVPRELARELDPLDPRDPRYLSRLHAWTLRQEGRLEGMYTNPAHPGVEERVLAVVDDLLWRYDLDGIHLDYIRYPSPDFGYSRTSREAFREWMLGRVPEGERTRLDALVRSGRILTWIDAYREEFDRFRESRIDRLVARVADRVRMDPDRPLLTAAVFADPVDARQGRFQNWQPWVRQGRVDVVIPMAYTPDPDRWTDLMRAGLEADPTGERVWMGIGIWQDDFGSALAKARLALASRVGGVVLFSYDWAAHDAPAVDGRRWLDAWFGELDGR